VPLVTVKNKFQVVIPAKVRQRIGIKVGDLLEANAEKGKVVLIPKSAVDREIAEGLDDIRKGRTYGPFESAEEMIRFLHAQVKEHKVKERNRKRSKRK
jgi:AbrB family looped-hinge helix DNA binding protein